MNPKINRNRIRYHGSRTNIHVPTFNNKLVSCNNNHNSNHKDTMNPNERKKQTHLRCERQRREAINSGYNELKDLLPASASFIGCKTTNAAILFRAADYVKALESSIEKNDEELSKLKTQYAALEMILQQYENFSFDAQTFTVLQLQMLQSFLDVCYESFVTNVDTSSYKSLTSSLLLWIERIEFQSMSEALLTPVYNN